MGEDYVEFVGKRGVSGVVSEGHCIERYASGGCTRTRYTSAICIMAFPAAESPNGKYILITAQFIAWHDITRTRRYGSWQHADMQDATPSYSR